MPEFLDVCQEAARAGAAILQQWVGRIAVREKGPSDLVTEADLASQEAVRSVVLGAFPDHAFLGEEAPLAARIDSEYRWIVDPLDGTTNYVHQIPFYAVSVALEHRGRPIAGTVLNPVSGECFTAAAGWGAFLNEQRLAVSRVDSLEQAIIAASFPAKVERHFPILRDFTEVLVRSQGIRRTGSAALNLCYVAAGRFDAYWARETNAWDVAAGVLIVQEAGGLVTGIDGSPFTLTDPRFVAASTESLHRQLQAILSQSQ